MIGITGCSGTLGQIVRERVASLPRESSCFEGDLCSAADIETWVLDRRPSRVIHLAARVPLDRVARDPLAAFDVNVLGTARLLGALGKLGGAPWIFYASTSHVYASQERPIGEDDAVAPQNAYGETKHLAEQVVLYHARHGAVRACVGRIFSFYHPTQKKPFLYPAMMERLAERDPQAPFALRGGNNIRDLQNAEQVVDAIMSLMERECEGVVNIGSGVGTKISDFVRGLAGGELNIETSAEDRVTSLVADVSRLRSLIDDD